MTHVLRIHFTVTHVVNQQILPRILRLKLSKRNFRAGNYALAIGHTVRIAAVIVGTIRQLTPRHSRLILRLLSNRLHHAIRTLAFGKLINHCASWSTRAGHQHGTNAVRINRGVLQGRKRVLVQIVRNRNLRVLSAQIVKLIPNATSQRAQITGINTNTAKFRTCNFHSRLYCFFNVVSVHKKRRTLAQSGNLGSKSVAFSVVHERKAVSSCANRLQTVNFCSKKVCRTLKTANYCGTRRSDSRILVRAAAAHIHARTPGGGRNHAGCSRRNRAIVIKHGKQHGFKQSALAKSAFYLQNWRIWEEHLTFAISGNFTVEAEIFQPFNGLSANNFTIT